MVIRTSLLWTCHSCRLLKSRAKTKSWVSLYTICVSIFLFRRSCRCQNSVTVTLSMTSNSPPTIIIGLSTSNSTLVPVRTLAGIASFSLDVIILKFFGIPFQRGGEVLVALPSWRAYYVASHLQYALSPPLFAYRSGLIKAFYENAGLVSLTARMENLLKMLTYFLAASRDDHLSPAFACSLFHNQRGTFHNPLLVGLSVDLELLASTTWFVRLALLPSLPFSRCSVLLEKDDDSYVDVELRFGL